MYEYRSAHASLSQGKRFFWEQQNSEIADAGVEPAISMRDLFVRFTHLQLPKHFQKGDYFFELKNKGNSSRTVKTWRLQSRESNPLFHGYEPYVIVRFTRLQRRMKDSNLQVISDRLVSNQLQYHYGNTAGP